MAFNPFLSMNEPTASVTTEELNPFMMADAQPVTFDSADNPFAISNPFSDFGGGEYEPPVGDTVPADIFGDAEPTGIGAKQFIGFEVDNAIDLFGNQPVKPTKLELITTTADSFPDDDVGLQQSTRPLPPETQNLILSVTGQMEFNSSHLLDRIPLTRTPSPVSVRDIHSPSPTPELEFEPREEPAPVVEPAETTRAKPARPPPARPPLPPPVARPPPPRPAPPPVPQMPQRPPPPQTTDEINLFDAPAPVLIKPTKEAILSLYSVPKKQEKQIDFLSDDIMDSMSTEPATEDQITSSITADFSVVTTAIGNAADHNIDEDITTSDPTAPVSAGGNMFPPALSSSQQAVAPMDCSEPPTEETLTPVHKTSPFADFAADDLQPQPEEQEKNPFESGGEMDTTEFSSPGANIFGIDSADHNMTTENVFGMDNSPFGAAPVAVTSTKQTNIFGTTSSPFDDNNSTIAFASRDNENVFGLNQGMTSSSFEDKNHGDTFASSTSINNDIFEVSKRPSSGPFDDTNRADTFATGGGVNDYFGANKLEGSVDQAWAGGSEAMVQNAIPDAQEAFSDSHDAFPESQDAFDAFSAKFDSTSANHMNTSAWGDAGDADDGFGGFEAEAFDTFLSMGAPPPPAATPRLDHQGSRESTEDTFSVFIRPKDSETSGEESAVPALAPPPRPPAAPESPRVNPFDRSGFEAPCADTQMVEEPRRGSGSETPPTPLFDEDQSQPLEEFPRVKYAGPGWEMHLRQPNKKKITGQRFWKKIFIRLAVQGDTPVVQLLNAAGDKEPFQELPLQACYSVSEVGAQQFDQYGKIFTVKLQYVFYKERPGVRPGQVTKAERITNKLSQFAAYAIQGDYQGVKEFGSDLRKLGLPVEHAPQVSQLFKIGSLCYEDVKQFSCCVEEALFRLSAHRDRALTYKMEEVQITAVDELYVEQDAEGSVLKQIARVRLFFIGFLSGMPDVELGVNDLRRQGCEVVGRHDIIPVVTEEWIRVESPEFHACVIPQDFHDSQIIKFKPPDACYIELMRFRIRPPKNRELPLQLKAVWCVTGNKVELRADVLVPGFASRKLGQVPCEDVCIRFPIPECWIYLFRVEKHFRYGSVKSAHRRTGKIKGIERFLGAVDTLQESLIEVTSGQAKYEHQHRAIVWRMPRLPKEGQGAYTTHNLVCRMALTSYDQVPSQLAPHALVEFTMPATAASHVTVRSVSLQNHDSDDPPEKYVRYLARHEYIVGIERTSGQSAPAYAVAAKVEAPPAPPAPAPAAPIQPPSSDSDSD